jgi:predicted AlkP superfamily phosphohydrolase/phosphomutase
MTTTKTIILGLDGADFGLVRRWAREGHLSFLNTFLESGHVIETNVPELPGSEWANFGTGVGPGYHGYVHSTQLRPGTYETERAGAGHVQVRPFYKFLGDAGPRCVVLDLPGDFPQAAFNGLQIVDWGSEFKLWRYETRPRSLKRRIASEAGEHPLTRHTYTDPGIESLKSLRAKLEEGVRVKGALARRLLAMEDWDFSYIGFGEGHKAGHFFWKFFDPGHPDFDAADPYLAGALLAVYQALDREMEHVVQAIRKPVNVMIVSDRGMQGELRGDHLLTPVLQGLGVFASPRGGAQQADTEEAGGRARVGFLAGARRLVPAQIKPLARRLLGREKADWSKTRAFQLPSVGNSYIRINVKGREPRGIVEPGAEYESLVGYLERELYALVNPDTGEKAIQEVAFPQRKYSGPLIAQLPDISIVWQSDAHVNALWSPRVGRIQGVGDRQRSGNHNGTGFVLAQGPALSNFAFRGPGDLRQIAPTIFRIFQLDPPAHLELPALDILGADHGAADDRHKQQKVVLAEA